MASFRLFEVLESARKSQDGLGHERPLIASFTASFRLFEVLESARKSQAGLGHKRTSDRKFYGLISLFFPVEVLTKRLMERD
jgi:hypothetical protein